MLEYSYAGVSDVGCVRHNNEDALSWDEDSGLVIVADGMGGYNAGEVASNMAASFIQDEMIRWLEQAGRGVSVRHVARALQICVTNANLQILQSAQRNPDYAGMGTTLVVGVFGHNHLTLGHIGDSRCYLLRDNTLHQLTHDHSLLQEQLDSGLITPADALVSPQKNFVTRALGTDDDVVLETQAMDVEPGDVYLFCTDGLSDMLDEAALAQVLRGIEDTDHKAKTLVHLANARGGPDNVTALVVQAGKTMERSGFGKLLFR